MMNYPGFGFGQGFGYPGYGWQGGMGTPGFGYPTGFQGGWQGMGGMGMGMPGYGFPTGFRGGWGPMYGGGPGMWGGTFAGPGFGYAGFAGVPSDEEITDMVYDNIDTDPVVPYDAEINVEVKNGTVTLTGTVPSKRAKHAVGDDAWWVPGVYDVNNNLNVAGRRQRRGAPTTGTRTPTGQQEGTRQH